MAGRDCAAIAGRGAAAVAGPRGAEKPRGARPRGAATGPRAMDVGARGATGAAPLGA
jgi:hypothetical protein